VLSLSGGIEDLPAASGDDLATADDERERDDAAASAELGDLGGDRDAALAGQPGPEALPDAGGTPLPAHPADTPAGAVAVVLERVLELVREDPKEH
jgi:hypothetical protein